MHAGLRRTTVRPRNRMDAGYDNRLGDNEGRQGLAAVWPIFRQVSRGSLAAAARVVTALVLLLILVDQMKSSLV